MSEPAFDRVDTPELAAALEKLRPIIQDIDNWAWFDFLTPGDVARVFLLREIAQHPDGRRALALDAMSEILSVAKRRRAEAPALGVSEAAAPQ